MIMKFTSFLNIQKKYMDLKISTKILVVYLLFLISSLGLSSFIYQKIYYDIANNKVSELSLQTLYSIKSNVNNTISNVSYNSKVILSNNNIQNFLRNSDNGVDLVEQRNINSYLTDLVESMPYISSIYIFDNFGHKYGVDKFSMKSFKFSRVEDAGWYKEVMARKGFYILKLNAGEESGSITGENYISLIRVINDMATPKQPLGILMINISESAFINCYSDIVKKYGTDITLLDEDNRSIVKKKDLNLELINEEKQYLRREEQYSVTERIKGIDYVFSFLTIGDYNWKVISSVPFNDLSRESSIFYLVALAVILINGVLLFLGTILVSRLITTPIKKLLNSMKGVEKGNFKKVSIHAGNDEIGKLRDGYNIMVDEIEKLIIRVIEEQKTKRKAELNVLQEQIKPHFLYNTLDAMGYLALSGQSDKVYEALEAMGGYYRRSLSKGSETISICDEINIVKDYLILQKLRYGDVFTDVYDIDEKVSKYRIPKLVLQPLVENALYHGIKPKGEKGVITVSAQLAEDMIQVSVEDDGVGMSEEKLDEILGDHLDSNDSSFGLRGTIERLRIYYGIRDVYRIESSQRCGTKVTIRIPAERGA